MFKTYCLGLAFLLASVRFISAGEFTWSEKPGSILFYWEQKQVLEYSYQDKDIARPYFARLYSPNGTQLTRNHPPTPGADAVDHPTMHPGAWLSFGDVSGFDYWRNKARTLHVSFVSKPVLKGGEVHFKVRNHYLAGLEKDSPVRMVEEASYTLRKHNHAYSLTWESDFKAPEGDIVFGDQEELGLGVRMNTPITVKKGGKIVNSEGLFNEKGTWGKVAQWVDYSGKVGDKEAGVTLVASSLNQRPSWFHTRDYGLMVANLFAKKAFTKQESDLVRIPRSQNLKLSYLLILHDGGTFVPGQIQTIVEQSGWKQK